MQTMFLREKQFWCSCATTRKCRPFSEKKIIYLFLLVGFFVRCSFRLMILSLQYCHQRGNMDLAIKSGWRHLSGFLLVISILPYMPIHRKKRKITSHCNENPFYVFLFWELRGQNFNIHVPMSTLYNPRIRPDISCSRIGRLVGIYNRQHTHECENWDCGRAIPFLGIFVLNFLYWFFAVHCFRMTLSRIIRVTIILHQKSIQRKERKISPLLPYDDLSRVVFWI
jgi:hypothetical protein